MRKNKFFILPLFVLCLAAGCKKVEKNDVFLHSIYSVLSETSNLYRTNGSFFTYQYLSPAYKTFVAGDTLTIAGILGGSAARRQVTIGDSTVQLFNQASYRLYNKTTNDTIGTNVDYMQCRMPRGETGNTAAVTVTVNGVTINAPAVLIQQYFIIARPTAPTLVGEKVGEGLPST